MRLIKPSYNIIEQPPGLEGVYKMIEIAGRTCYKSESNITEDSAKSFVDRMIKSGHGAMLEHGTVYLDIPWNATEEAFSLQLKLKINKYDSNKYSRVVDTEEHHSYITTNLRVLVENGWLDDLQYICEPTEHHIKRVSVRFICDRGVSHEFVRHRVMSFAQESTRYCNYSKDKFGNEITFIYPCWLPDGDLSVESEECFKYALQKAEQSYFHLLQEGWLPQQARAVLPNSLKTELVMTGFTDDWKHFFFLRDAAPAHPQARELAEPLHKEFIEKGYIK
jgi:thymidylate synthase (FAD)